ncbi:hypothetical protein JCM33774_18660 [Actinophytocola sp. KF-1]
MSQPRRDPLRAVWLAFAMIVALFVGTAAGVLGWLSGQSPAAAVLTGGVAFGGTLTLAIVVIRFFHG